MKRLIVILSATMGGCSAYTEAQMHLVEQARKGLQIVKTAEIDRAAVVAQFQQLQQKRLDEAFDADVLQRGQVSADWVIEARKAYSAARSALETQRAASVEVESAARRNIDAVDTALSRLLMMQEVQLRFMTADGMATWAKQ